MSLQIVHYNDPILRQKGEKITVFDAALAELAAAMTETMHEAGGIGLAAQQIGRAVQLCVVDLRRSEEAFEWMLDGAKPPKDVFMPLVVANPKVVAPKGGEETVMEEGCLSFPEIRGDVYRPDRITVQFQDERGGAHVLACNGLLSRCIQHEVDHLRGVLFIERMKKEVRSGIDEAVKALAKKTREGEKAKVSP
ncbi:MAG TPA: peptide deformylase [Opitutaceae bacterium]|jgi:peptide deformylase|nr:peptide deformylase [Opitutaceae bacterium]